MNTMIRKLASVHLKKLIKDGEASVRVNKYFANIKNGMPTEEASEILKRTRDQDNEDQAKAAIETMIEFVIAHKRDIANGLNDFGDLKPALKWINEMDIETKGS